MGTAELMAKSGNSKVICIIGVDGTGKTAHAVETLNYLQSKGQRCKYVWFGQPYVISYPFMVLCRFLGLTKMHYLQQSQTYVEHQYYRNKPVALIWPWLVLIDLKISASLRVFLLALLGYTVVCDRYIYDILVEIMSDINDYKFYDKVVGRAILRLRPKSTFIVLFDVSDLTAFQRKKDIPNIEYVTRRRRSYHLIAKHLKIPIINADQPFEVVQKQLIALL